MGIDARRMLTGRRLLITAVAAAAVAGGGSATAAAAAAQDDTDEGVPSGARVTASQAAQAALQAAPGTAEEIDLDDDGKTAWEVDVVTTGGERRTLTVDAGSGKVVENRADRHDDEDGREAAAAEAKALGSAKTTAAAAAKAAAAAASGTVTSVDFETDGGKPGWEVEVAGKDGVEHDVTVDAASGKVLENQADDESDDNDDNDDDESDDQGDDD